MAERDHMIKGYARAVFAVAEAEGALDRIEDELFRFERIVQGRPDLRESLTNPSLPSDRKKAMLEDLLGGKATPHTISLLGFVVEQGRARDLPRIVEAVTEFAAERRRKTVAEVRSALPLDPKRVERLARALSKATGKDVEVKLIVDPEVIGGIVARVGDQVFDGTIRRKLEVARQRLTQVR